MNKDKIGEKYGLLTIIDYIVVNNKGYFVCVCECGNVKKVRANHLISGRIKSCGCLYKLRKRSKVPPNEFVFFEDCKKGIMDDGRYFLYDIEDAEIVEQYDWYFDADGYVVARENKKACKLHRKILQIKDHEKVDHINHNHWDNRKINLRIATDSENAANSLISSRNNSGIIGVSWLNRNSMWRARITYKGKEIYLGLFDRIDDAIKQRLLAEKKYFKEFAPQKHLFEKYNIEDGE